MVCILRGEPSAVPRPWVGVVLVGAAADGSYPTGGSAPLQQVIAFARAQVPTLILFFAGGDARPLASHGLPVVTAATDGGDPLASGVLAGLEWTAVHARETPWIATFSGAAPWLPADLVARLARSVGEEGADLACAACGERRCWEFALWPVRLRRALRRAMGRAGFPGLATWAQRYRVAIVSYPEASAWGTTAIVTPPGSSLT